MSIKEYFRKLDDMTIPELVKYLRFIGIEIEPDDKRPISCIVEEQVAQIKPRHGNNVDKCNEVEKPINRIKVELEGCD